MASTIPLRVRELKVGDLVDLEGDIFADYDRYNNRLASEYVTVKSITPAPKSNKQALTGNVKSFLLK